ncbi:efflux RND transporter periplasmic adaptor subunit [Pseudomonas lalucatii]|nr:efflux RND transporter periplasmic adaptor subunit [Pseudomonas lalucatii]
MPARTCRFVVVIVLLLAGVPGLAETGQGPLVEVVRPERGLVRDELITFGSLRSAESVMIRPEIDGRLARLHFREGQAVSAGDLLVSLDDAIARAELALARANLDLAESNLRRSQLLFQRGASNAQALDEARAEAQARRASLALARARLDKTQIRAPYDGLLGLRQVSPGDYLEAGQDIVNLEVLDPLKLDFRVPQKAVGQVHPGQAVEVRLDAFADEVFRGSISAVNPQLDVAGRSQAIRAQLGNPERRLKPGQFVRVTVIIAERPQALLIPEEAVMPLGERLLVNLVVDGRVEQREIRLGRRLGGRAEVREGLDGDETLISAGWHKVRPGMAVRTRPAGEGA